MNARIVAVLIAALLSLAAAAADWDLALAPEGEPGRPLVLDGWLPGLPDSMPIRGATI